jgi:acetoin utilization protein AcuB
MTEPAVTVEADDPIRKAARLIAESGHNHLPVEEDGHLVGIVTRADVLRALAAE